MYMYILLLISQTSVLGLIVYASQKLIISPIPPVQLNPIHLSLTLTIRQITLVTTLNLLETSFANKCLRDTGFCVIELPNTGALYLNRKYLKHIRDPHFYC